MPESGAMLMRRKSDTAAVLNDHFLLRHLADAERDELLARARIERYAAGQRVFSKGDAESGLMAVLAGRIKLTSMSPDGNEMLFDILDGGRVFGEIALLDGKPRSHDATALEASEVLVLSRRDFIPFLEARPAICIRFMAELCARLRRTDEMVEDALFLGLPPRLAKRLLHLAETFGRAGESGHVRIGLRLSQKDLASLVGMSRESINKQVRRWRESGIIDVARGTIIIRDMARLRAIVESVSDPRA